MELVIQCKICGLVSEVIEINCNRFICGYYRDTLLQLNPHLSMINCNELQKKDLIIGCGVAFTIIDNIAIPCKNEF